MFKIEALDHVALSVRDLERSARWYADVLGFKRQVRTLHFAFRADRENFLRAQDELKKRAIAFDFQDHEISHSIYFRDPDGHEIEITTYQL